MSAKTVEKMMERIEDSLQNGPALPPEASFVGYSEYCSSKTQRSAGITFREYIYKRSLPHAAETFKSTDSRIIDIALDCGLSSSKAFARALGREYSRSPLHLLATNDAADEI